MRGAWGSLALIPYAIQTPLVILMRNVWRLIDTLCMFCYLYGDKAFATLLGLKVSRFIPTHVAL